MRELGALRQTVKDKRLQGKALTGSPSASAGGWERIGLIYLNKLVKLKLAAGDKSQDLSTRAEVFMFNRLTEKIG